jgi:hypothetical protein
VETTLPRIRQVGESASPRLDVEKYLAEAKTRDEYLSRGYWKKDRPRIAA